MHVVRQLFDSLHGFIRGVCLFLRNHTEGKQNGKINHTGIVEEASNNLSYILFPFVV